MNAKSHITYIIIIILLLGSTYWGGNRAIYYYRGYNISQRSLSVYINEYGQLRNGFEEARQLIFSMGVRNKSITKTAREALEYLTRKY